MLDLADTVLITPPADRTRADPYAQLKLLITERGLLERRPSRYLGQAATLALALALIVAGLVLTRGSWWALAWTLPATLLFGQFGFMAHEAAHNQIMRTSRGNYVLSLLLFNLSVGASRGWWANKHNLHHAQPNRIGVDPDIGGGPIATSEAEALRSRGLIRVLMRRQATAIWPLMSLGVLQIHVYSAGFLCNRRLRHAALETGLLLTHGVVYVGGLVLLLGAGRGLLFALVHQMLVGVYVGSVFLTNHLGMPMLQPGEPGDFLHRQVMTSRNLRASRLTDYFSGVLSCQIEHHLFPTMPRRHLRTAAPLVRRFCEEWGVPYHETTVIGAFGEVRAHLAAVVRPLGRRYGTGH